MVETYGLTHIALGVRDPERSFRFYHAVLGVVEVFRDRAGPRVPGPETGH